ncbi:sensor histidine kinase KdpD [Mucilaginibacter sp. L3T2-6]|uniref:sensor histidine kinase n=1 Tax=Mucilaginibacter sp. L3T2-6 TaxID=3062491 RepID=UPI0026763740|nr:HAMP domain-containing sensor histidine kinase [Mucilaginibacter sp. L3T2-6]MDO3643668.1 HAMP domain-containing sensor histidine kinase [Mucilaginibacter sp. L3T2-6]MDV6216084.1 HAMP domain-containing sensor histidine kinase [Mucilaginibacter sp. L3T2-6]
MDYKKFAAKISGQTGEWIPGMPYRFLLVFCAGAIGSVLLLAAFAVTSYLFSSWPDAGIMQFFGGMAVILVVIIVSLLTYNIVSEHNGRLHAEQEHELDVLKSNFITLASHEFRTPLSSILLSATLIEKYARKQDTENAAKHAVKIKQVVHRLEGILEDFLSLEQLDAGQVISNATNFNLDALCQFSIAEARLSGAPGQNFRYEAAGNAALVRLDEVLLQKTLSNLLSNAVKYAGDEADICLSTNVTDTQVIIRVKDNGVGIATKDHKQLFTIFFRANDSGNVPGTGLGLYLVKRYVQLMGGTLHFYSEPMLETCFEMVFPIHTAPETSRKILAVG